MPDREKVEKGLTICTSTEPCNGCPYLPERNCSLAMVKDALELLKEQPEIVRCKDCIHYRYYGLTQDTVSECTIDHCENPDEEWYCADGERRTDDALDNGKC